MVPAQIKVKQNNYLYIKWDDSSTTEVKIANLRRNCPCAICSADREQQGEKYIPIYTDAQLKIENIKMIGSYAIGVIWSDEHNTGIYDYNYLRKLSGS
jgi:DUF971 family protein